MNSAAERPLRPVSRRTMARLRARVDRPIRLVLMGEYSAGKSTLLNLLVGREVAPVQVTATQAPPLWLSYGAEPAAELMGRDGKRTQIPPDRHRDVGVTEAMFVRLRLPARDLLRYDVIDTPGLSDPLLAAEIAERVARYGDVPLWCTSAMQAWRQSEKAAWMALPDRLKTRGVLVVTHADRLTEAERARMLSRLDRETSGLFRERVLISARDAARARMAGPDGIPMLEASGGTALAAALGRMVAVVDSHRRAMLSRYAEEAGPSERPQRPERRQPQPQRPRPQRPRAEPRSEPRVTTNRVASAPRPVDLLDLFDVEAAALPNTPNAADVEAFIDRMIANATRVHPDAQQSAWAALLCAHQLDAGEPAGLMRQMRGETSDFADGEWCDLSPA